MGQTNKIELTNQDLRKSYILWISMVQATYSYERMQAPGFLSAMIPAIERFYPDNKEERIKAAKRHMEFFNTEPWMTGPSIIGLTLSLEEERANGIDISDEDINGVKTSLMGPSAGVGDTLRQATLIPIIGSIAISMGLAGSFLGPVFYMLATLFINYGISYWLFKFSYQKGKMGVASLFASGKLERVMTMATTVGAICLGGMAATTVKLKSHAVFTLGENQLVLQDLFDKVIANILPLTLILCTYYLIAKKKMNAVRVLLILVALATGLTVIGF